MEGKRAVLYLRLSKEDKDKLCKGDESASIINQRLLLKEYASRNGYEIIDVYADDDESGLYDDRLEFSRMITDAKKNKFDVIIAKTQSRFSRNIQHIEKYLHHEFVNWGIRFIGVVDGVDTNDFANKKTRQISGLVNEWYCEDLSKNIRSAFAAKRKEGQFLGASCPYGYCKDAGNHNHLVVDTYASQIVKEIYRLYLQGHGKSGIGKILTERGVLIPSIYKQEVLGLSYKNGRKPNTTRAWCYQTIHTILNNRTYTGCVVQHKSETLSYKDRKKCVVPKNEWVIVENKHEPIISEEMFEQVQRIQQIRTREVKGEEKGVFAGKILCADCKKTMVRLYDRRGGKACIGYVCKTYKNQGRKFCEGHRINIDELEEAVLEDLQRQAEEILTDKDIKELRSWKKQLETVRKGQDSLKIWKKKEEKIKTFKEKTYQNYLEELLTKEEYIRYTKNYDRQLEEIEFQKEKIGKDKELTEKKQENKWLNRFLEYIHVEKMTREMVLELIDFIEVNRDGSIQIQYRFK